MKKSISLGAFIAVIICAFTACNSNSEKETTMNNENPFYHNYDTPFNTIPFDKIKTEHYRQAMTEGIELKKKEVLEIANNPEAPTFKNTILAYEKSGKLLSNTTSVFYNLTSAHTNDDLKAIAKEFAPKFSAMYDDFNLNENFFKRVKSLYENMDKMDYTEEQKTVITNKYKSFVRGGANLTADQKERFRAINEELSGLCLTFGDNVLNETNDFKVFIDNIEDLEGLPEDNIKAAATEAKAEGQEGKYLFSIHKPSFIPVLTYCKNRNLRETLLKAYSAKGNQDNAHNNKENIVKIVNLRLERANLLGYASHAHFVLDDNMASNPENVFGLMNKVWEPAKGRAKEELAKMKELAKAEGMTDKFEAWDWWYYAEKVKEAEYAFNEEMLKPYFKLENVIEGCFHVANQLWGLEFKEIEGIATYHEEVKTYEVLDKNGEHLAIYYADAHPRPSKRGGAWMNDYRPQHKMNDGVDQRPHITNVMNFTKPTEEKPSLLSVDETLTCFHEFGHAVHGMLSNCTYASVSGTNTPRDFVEFPSQVFENWAMDEQALNVYAKHFETGENIPDELLAKMRKAGTFNQGFSTVEYLSAAYLDMKWHTITEPFTGDVNEFETQVLNEIGLMDEIIVRYKSTYFNHIFSSPTGYSSGYYGYLWAEVLDADTYKYFSETNVFDKEKAASFRNEILSKGSTEDVMTMYKRFRGMEPQANALLERKGFTTVK